ncbi:hypothetical protein H9L14_03940 [Sphingomonas sediminicola]|uniref:Uncharacterized protein n=1 Tax=Sphingomonas sediminicola TaxID=386874 RepID=A0ABX6TFH8_9SPHN|nr:hypothetical protein [Sphingomonas sediminicola]QNP46353.1 hypothetical protein H9L14_03940 [Sphingomonas sediminicola]
MGAPVGDMKAVDNTSAEALLDAFKEISPAERRRHATVFNYWLSIRGDRPFPPIRDLDPLEISDAGPCSILLEVMGGGDDADIRHLGHALKDGNQKIERISEAARPSLLSCIANQLPIVASSRQPIAFEDNFPSGDSTTHCWITLLPFSSTGKWIDYVYGFVSLKGAGAAAEEPVAAEDAEVAEVAEEKIVEPVEEAAEPAAELVEESAELEEPQAEVVEPEAEVLEAEPEPAPEPEAKPRRPGFSAKIFDALAGVEGFYGNIVKMDPKLPSTEDELQSEPEAVEQEAELEASAEPEVASEPEPEVEAEEAFEEEMAPEPEAVVEEVVEDPIHDEEIAEEPVEKSAEAIAKDAVVVTSGPEGTLQNKLAEVRSKADEARMAKIRSNLALYEGLSAAYDFALDAEESADEYLKLVEDQGLKIQLRSPMKPVVKLAFDGMCDDATISQLEAVLAWALKQDLPRGSLAARIEEAGGIAPILNGQAKAA